MQAEAATDASVFAPEAPEAAVAEEPKDNTIPVGSNPKLAAVEAEIKAQRETRKAEASAKAAKMKEDAAAALADFHATRSAGNASAKEANLTAEAAAAEALANETNPWNTVSGMIDTHTAAAQTADLASYNKTLLELKQTPVVSALSLSRARPLPTCVRGCLRVRVGRTSASVSTNLRKRALAELRRFLACPRRAHEGRAASVGRRLAWPPWLSWLAWRRHDIKTGVTKNGVSELLAICANFMPACPL
eukprot:SAG22_NODE_2290_length_2752_cov_2.249152_1_plen_248_part_00